jgi:hypothetical protein
MITSYQMCSSSLYTRHPTIQYYKVRNSNMNIKQTAKKIMLVTPDNVFFKAVHFYKTCEYCTLMKNEHYLNKLPTHIS